jgi:TolB-like protein/DNA-binding winged helix-turn-helix (wHTH) protein
MNCPRITGYGIAFTQWWRRFLKYQFSGFTADFGLREVSRDGEPIAMPPQSIDLLSYLIENRDRAIDKDELQNEVWGTIVTDSAMSRSIMKLRQALGDTSGSIIKTVPRFGYRFVAEIDVPANAAVSSTVPEEATFARRKLFAGAILALALSFFAVFLFGQYDAPNEPAADAVDHSRTIAVLPFINLSSDTDQEWFADGLTEALLTTLSRAPDLMVSSRTSSFYYKDSEMDVRTIAEQLGVAHVIEGSVRRGNDNVRVNAQLIRAADGFNLWSETFDKSLDDVIVLQEELAYAIANAMETAMDSEALAAMVSAGTSSVAAYELYLEAIARYNRFSSNGDPDDIRGAMVALEEAVSIDPEFAAAHFRLAEAWRGQLAINSFSLPMPGMSYIEQKEQFTRSVEAAIAAAKFAPERRLYEAKLAQVNLRFREAVRAYSDYLEARPSDFDAWYWLSQVYQQIGEYDRAFEAVNKAASHPGLNATLDTRLIYAYSRTGHTREGMDFGQRLIALEPTHATALYQTHRSLLLAAKVEEAAALLPRIQASDLFSSQKALATGRQACAEGRTEDAEAVFEETELNELSWIFLQVLGRPAEAADTISHLDVPDRHYQLSNFMVYPEFDAKYYPNLQLVLAREHVQRPPPSTIPYSCLMGSN